MRKRAAIFLTRRGINDGRSKFSRLPKVLNELMLRNNVFINAILENLYDCDENTLKYAETLVLLSKGLSQASDSKLRITLLENARYIFKTKLDLNDIRVVEAEANLSKEKNQNQDEDEELKQALAMSLLPQNELNDPTRQENSRDALSKKDAEELVFMAQHFYESKDDGEKSFLLNKAYQLLSDNAVTAPLGIFRNLANVREAEYSKKLGIEFGVLEKMKLLSFAAAVVTSCFFKESKAYEYPLMLMDMAEASGKIGNIKDKKLLTNDALIILEKYLKQNGVNIASAQGSLGNCANNIYNENNSCNVNSAKFEVERDIPKPGVM